MLLTIFFLCVILGLLLWLFLSCKFSRLLLEFVYEVNSNERNAHTLSIPGPRTIPFFGSKWIYIWKYKLSKVHEVYADLRKKYGPIVLETLSDGIPIVSIYDRQDIEKVLRYPSKYPFRPPIEIAVFYRRMRNDRYASIGVVNEQGESWQYLRSRLTQDISSPRVLKSFLPALNCICDDFIDLLRTKRDPDTMKVENFENIVNSLALEAVCTLMLGKRMGFLSQRPPENIAKLASSVRDTFIIQRDTTHGFSWWKYFSTKTYRDFIEIEDTIYNVVSEIVDEALCENSSKEFIDDGVNAVFKRILCDKDLDIRDKKSAIIDFITAGIGTVTNTIIFLLNFVSSREGILDEIEKEFYGCDEIESNSLTQAVFTKACLQETFRIRPVAFCLTRILEEDTVLSGYNVQAGTVVLCQNMVSCHDPENFNDPERFLPERWLADDWKINSRCTEVGAKLVQPFGVGRRQCPGKRFVEMELMLILAKMARSFTITFCDELELEFEFILAPKPPINLILNDRVK